MKYVKPFKSIPGPISLPLIGNLWQYTLGIECPINYHKTIEGLYAKYGPVVKQKLGSKSVTHVFLPEDAKTIYHHEGKLPHIMPLQDTIFLFRKNENLTLGLGNSNGDEWYRLRDSLKHLMLTPKGVQNFTSHTDSVTREFCNELSFKANERGVVHNLRVELSKWSLETAGLMCFGKRLGYMKEEKRKHVESLIKANKAVFYLSTLLKFSLPLYEHFYSPVWKELHRSETEILSETVKNTKEALEQIKELAGNEKLLKEYFCFLITLLNREDITEKDIYILTQSLFTDGLSTTVPSLIYNLFCLAAYPEIQSKAYKEISQCIKKDEPITNEVLNQLSYIKAIVKETFRLYPIGTEISRIVKSDMVLSGYEIPKETHVNINMNMHFQSEKYFDDPKSFKPERWIRSSSSTKLDPFVLTPFGHGARTCLGRRFAEQNIHIALGHLLLNYDLQLENPGIPMDQVYNILLFPKGNSKIRFIPRK